MSDTRELLLARSVVIAEGQSGIVKAMRNGLQISESALPGYNVFDGNEEIVPELQADRGRPGRVPPGVPLRAVLLPEFLLMLQDRPDDVGTVLSGFRTRLIKAVLTDTVLLSLCGTTGGITYQGYETDLGWGRQQQGAMVLRFAYTYTLDIKKF